MIYVDFVYFLYFQNVMIVILSSVVITWKILWTVLKEGQRHVKLCVPQLLDASTSPGEMLGLVFSKLRSETKIQI